MSYAVARGVGAGNCGWPHTPWRTTVRLSEPCLVSTFRMHVVARMAPLVHNTALLPNCEKGTRHVPSCSFRSCEWCVSVSCRCCVKEQRGGGWHGCRLQTWVQPSFTVGRHVVRDCSKLRNARLYASFSRPLWRANCVNRDWCTSRLILLTMCLFGFAGPVVGRFFQCAGRLSLRVVMVFYCERTAVLLPQL